MTLMLMLAAALLAAPSAGAADPPKKKTYIPLVIPPEEREAHAQRMAWWREAKFGLFIHWGVYAIPAGEWQGKTYPQIGEWIMHSARIPVKTYEQLATQFNPVKFDPEQWAQLVEDAGMKYVVITSKHHDGFAMYDSKVSDYDIVDRTPFKRDVCRELGDAVRRHGFKYGFYYSQAQDWHEADGMGNFWDFDPAARDFDHYLDEKSLPQTRELLTGYAPDIMWFDTPVSMTMERAWKFRNLVRELQPDCLINGRLLKEAGGDYGFLSDNVVPDHPLDWDWETCATMNSTWGYKTSDNHWKSADALLYLLVDIVSKGGNLLLNVGPTAEGIIPEPSVTRLRQIGEWLKVNGDAIYGTTRSPFGAEFEGRAWRATQKGDKVYITVFEYPEGGLLKLTQPPPKPVKSAWMLADPDKKAIEIQREANAPGVTLRLPERPEGGKAFVAVLECGG